MIGFVGNNRGVALLVTVTLVTLMVAVSLELNQKVRTTVVTSAVVRDRVILSEMAFSGIHAAMAIMVKDKMESTVDTLQEDWANPERTKEMLTDIPYDEGTLTVDIQDELGKIQVNALVSGPGGRTFSESQRLLWDRYLTWLKEQHEDSAVEIDPATIINSLKDWMDSGDDEAITGLTGAESDFYQDLNPAYTCRNDPIKHTGELLRIKGISAEFFNGTDEIPGLSDTVTVYGVDETSENLPNSSISGRININTASLPVLMSLLPLENPEAAQLMIEYRQERDGDNYIHDISSPTWYKEVPGVGDIDIDSTIITTSSDFFRIAATAEAVARKITIRAIVRREQHKETGKWTCRILRLSTQ